MSKRLRKLSLFFLILFLLLVARLSHIQLIATESFSKHHINLIEESVNQRINSYTLDYGRGTFQDRHGEDLINQNYSLVIFPNVNENEWPVTKVAHIIGISEKELLEKISRTKKPMSFPIDQDKAEAMNDLKIPGVYAVTEKQKNSPFAQHIIGFTGQNQTELKNRYPELLEKGLVNKTTKIGLSGLEKAFDPFLISNGEAKLNYHVDNFGRPLFGLDVKYVAPANPFYPLKVKTTIDKRIQTIVEQAIDDAQINQGGAVLLDVGSSDVLALASRPAFDFSDPFETGAANEMTNSHIPGSVFKTVVAAAAIDAGIVGQNRSFDCDKDLYGENKSDRLLGQLTFSQSFTESCNRTFAQLGNELIREDPDFMERYADMLSLKEKVGWTGDVYHFENFEQIPNEEKNSIWKDAYRGERAVAQTAIGQLNVRLTPLSVANMMATIARGGEKKQVRLVSELLYKQGSSVIRFPEQTIPGETLDHATAKQLQQLLRQVIENPKGTGFVRGLNRLPYQVAGKSGTAQKNNKQQVNQWFAGYFPYDDPQYALVVVDLDDVGKDLVYHAYKTIVNNLYQYDSVNG